MVKGLIYACKYLITNKYYIGQTIQGLDRRKQEHIHSSFYECDLTYNLKFHKAIREFGSDQFQWEVLIEITSDSDKNLSESLNEMEWYYIKKYDSFNNGYNMTRGGDGNIIKPAKSIICYDVEGTQLNEFDTSLDASKIMNIHISTIKSVLNNQIPFVKKGYNRYVFKYEGDKYTNQEIVSNVEKLSNEKIYVFDISGKLIDNCLNLGKFCNKYQIKVNQARKCMNKETAYLISDIFQTPIFISRGEQPTKDQLKFTKSFYNSPKNRSRFFVKVINNITGESKLYSNLSKASQNLNIDYRMLQRNLGEFKKKDIQIDNYTIINMKYYGPRGERLC